MESATAEPPSTAPLLSPRRRKLVASLIFVLGLFGTVFDLLDWLGAAGPWVICVAAIVLFQWDHIAPWLRSPWRNRPMSKRRLRRESMALVRDMYDAAKESATRTIDDAKRREMSKAMDKATSEEEKSDIWHDYTSRSSERHRQEQIQHYERFGGRPIAVLDAFEQRGMIAPGDRHLMEWQAGSSGWLPDAARQLESLARRL